MYFTVPTMLATLLATLALAFPVPNPSALAADEPAPNPAETEPQWTLENTLRVCTEDDTACEWFFTINTHHDNQAPTPCKYTVKGVEGTPASQHAQLGVSCGPYIIRSGWSGHFGPEHGFTTLSIIDVGNDLVLFPAYTDEQLKDGKVVVPDQSWAPHPLQ